MNTPHQLSLFFWARIPRRLYVGHDKLKVELRVISHYKVPLTFYIHENHEENIALKIWKNTQMSYAFVLQYSLCFEKSVVNTDM